MPKKATPTPRARLVGKRLGAYREKLKKLREFTSEFDAKKFDQIYNAKPRTARGKAEKRAALSKVSRTFQRLRPFIHRPHKVVRVRSPKNLASLRDYVGMAHLKGLRAIPVPTDRKGTLKVSFDKKGRVTLKDGAAKHKVFLFPEKPRTRKARGRVIETIGDQLVRMTEAMLPKLPRGQFVLHTNHHFLMPSMADREDLAAMVRDFVYNYKADESFLQTLRGFKWITGSYEKAQQIKEYMATERGRRSWERKRLKSEAAAKAIAEMDRQFKRGKLSKRARATGRR